MNYYVSYNRLYSAKANILFPIALLVLWIGRRAPFDQVAVKVAATAVLVLIWIFGIRLVRQITIAITGQGIKVGRQHAGPFRSLSEFNPYAWQSEQTERQFAWQDIKSIAFGRWRRLWNPRHLWEGTSYVILEMTDGRIFITAIAGKPWSYAWNYKKEITEALRKTGHGNIVTSESFTF